MAHSDTNKKSTSALNDQESQSPGRAAASKQNGKTNLKSAQSRKARKGGKSNSDVPAWLGPVISAIGVGVAVGAGLYATRHQWMPKAGAWRDEFSAAFADDETDYENFDQTRHAGIDSMRDDPGSDWGDIDDMSDASFPASDPPSFTPGTAS